MVNPIALVGLKPQVFHMFNLNSHPFKTDFLGFFSDFPVFRKTSGSVLQSVFPLCCVHFSVSLRRSWGTQSEDISQSFADAACENSQFCGPQRCFSDWKAVGMRWNWKARTEAYEASTVLRQHDLRIPDSSTTCLSSQRVGYVRVGYQYVEFARIAAFGRHLSLEVSMYVLYHLRFAQLPEVEC